MPTMTQPIGYVAAILDQYDTLPASRAYDALRFDAQAEVLRGMGWTAAPRRGWWTDGAQTLPQRDAFPLACAAFDIEATGGGE